jgi:ketosteroid isomerase-like protein
MKRLAAALVASVLLAPAAMAATAPEVVAPIHQFIDGFNTGDAKKAFAAFAPGSVSIIDEFAPHLWTGPNAPHAWAAAFEKFAKAAEITDGAVKYGEPTRAEVEGKVAYVILPTVYSYKDHGKPTAEDGQMTFVLRSGAQGWKISAWTWSGPPPHPVN